MDTEVAKVIAPIEFVLAFSGLRLFPNSRTQKCLNFALSAVYLTSSYYILAVRIYNVKLSPAFLYDFTWIQYFLSSIAFHHSFCFRKHKIRTLIIELIGKMSNHGKLALLVACRRLRTFWMTGTIFSILSFSGYFKSDDWMVYLIPYDLELSSTVRGITIVVYGIICLGNTWLYSILTLCTFQIYACYKLDMEYFEYLPTFLGRTSKHFRAAIVERQRITNLKYRFEDVFNIFPFMIFGYLFISSGGYFILAKSDVHNLSLSMIISEWLLYFESLIMAFGFLVIVQKFEKRTFDAVTQCIQNIVSMDNSQCPYKFLLISEISDKTIVHYTGWSMFYLNKPFILNFAAALITFTVLFIQVTTIKM